MRRSLVLVAAVLALLVPAGCGGKGDREKRFVAIGQVLKQGPRLGTATVRARAFPVGRTAIVLAGPRKSVFALGSTAVIKTVGGSGTGVAANGPVRQLTGQQAKELGRELAKLTRRGDGSRVPPEVARAPRTPGTPYVAAQRIRPAQVSAKKGRRKP